MGRGVQTATGGAVVEVASEKEVAQDCRGNFFEFEKKFEYEF